MNRGTTSRRRGGRRRRSLTAGRRALPRVAEQQLRELVEVRAPEPPLVAVARAQAKRVLDAVLRERLVDRLRTVEREVLIADADPDQAHLPGRRGAVPEELRIRRVEVLPAARAHDDDVAKQIRPA